MHCKVLQIIILFCFLFSRSEVYSQVKRNGEEIIYSKANNKFRFNNLHDTMGVKYGNTIYFTRWTDIKAGRKIMDTNIYCFDIGKGHIKILSPLQSGDYEHRGTIINMLSDKSGRLFFSTSEHQDAGLDGAISWCYDLKSGEQKIFKEGIVSGIDKNGNVSILTSASDSKGPYTQTIKYNPKGLSVGFSERSYNKGLQLNR